MLFATLPSSIVPLPQTARTPLARTAEVWYGPTTATLPITVPGNPYDAETNDVRVVFVGNDGSRYERLAYFDGATWRATLTAPTSGTFAVNVMRNGQRVEATIAPIELKAKTTRSYVRKGGSWGLVTSDGKPYWPLGYNVAWTDDRVPDIAAELRAMGAAGANWSRVWTSFWDGKAGYMTPEFVRDGTIDLRAWAKWDPIVTAAEEAGVPFQFTLFHHGPWSSDVNTNWPDSPWNAKNGGFLAKPEDFFTDPKAMKLAKVVVRYTVARYAHSPGIMAWEIFNEVEWVDGIKRDPENVGRWHDAMATYIRSLDPYRHLITTSSGLDLPIWRQMDIWEPHGYPPAVGPFLLSTPVRRDRPFFFGEIGPKDLDGSKPVQVEAIRAAVWNALFMGHSGAAQYWSWDNVARDGLREEYAKARAILDRSGVIARGPLPLRTVDARSGSGADLRVVPSAGWAKSGRTAFDLPADAGAVATLPNYYQGQSHRDMMPTNATFAFTADRAGEARVNVLEAAGGGGNLELRLDGQRAARREFLAGSKGGETLVAKFGPGRHTLELVNDGADWVNLGGLSFSGIGPNVTAVGMGNAAFAMARLVRQDASGSPAVKVSLADLGVKGRATVEVTDLDTGKTRNITLDPTKDRLPMTERDVVLVVRKGR